MLGPSGPGFSPGETMTSASKPKVCKNAGDDRAHKKRPAIYEGPRCATCWGVEWKRRKEANHRAYVEKTYGVSRDFYDKLYAYQGGKCALCQRATGATKRLANDHDHTCCPGPTNICGKCLRGLLCGPCNEILGRWGNDPEVFLRGFRYIMDPPAQRLMRLLGMIEDDRRGTANTIEKVGAVAPTHCIPAS